MTSAQWRSPLADTDYSPNTPTGELTMSTLDGVIAKADPEAVSFLVPLLARVISGV